jgi:hypothetical protein
MQASGGETGAGGAVGSGGGTGTGGAREPTLSELCAAPECTNACAEGRFRAAVEFRTENLPETLASLPAACQGSARPPDGTFDGINTINEGLDIIVEIRDGNLAALDEVPCENLFPGRIVEGGVRGLSQCAESYQCGCCTFEFSMANSGTGWGLESTQSCDRFPPGLFEIGGPWTPPPPADPPPGQPACDLQSAPSCCFCYEECRICDSLRDIECWRDCYTRCRDCCTECPF